jgi:hypothetical protein
MEKIRQARKDLGVCITCGKSKDREGYSCISCNDKNNKLKYKRTLRLHQEGKCTNCFQVMDRKGWFCQKCLCELRIRGKELATFRRMNHLCVQCGESVLEGSYCRRCLDMRMNRYWNKKTAKINI